MTNKKFDTANGNNPQAATDFISELSSMLEQPGHDVVIKVGDIELIAYDHAALMTGLIDAVNYYAEELSLTDWLGNLKQQK